MFLAAVDVRGSHKAWGRKRSEVAGRLGPRVPQGPQARRRDGDQPRAPRRRVHPAGHRGADDAQGRRGAPRGHRPRPGPAGHRGVAGGHQARPAADLRAVPQPGARAAPRRPTTRAATGPSQDLPDVLARWGATLPPSRVHVVCCPPPDADPALLWQRFAGVVGFDPDGLPARRAGEREPVAGHHRDRPAAPGQRRPRQAPRAAGLRPGRQAALRPGDPRAGPLAPSGRPARDVRRPAGRRRAVGQGDRHGGVRRARRPGRRWSPSRPRSPGRTPTTCPPATRSTPPSPRPPSCCSRWQRGRGEVARLEADNARLRTKRKRLKRRLRAAAPDRA